MAAADPAKSPKRQKIAEEEVETCGEKTEAVESGCSARQKDENTCIKTGGSPNDEQRADVGSDGGGCVASHSEVTVESGAGADKTTCILPEDLRAAEKMAEASGSDQRPFDWSETEDDGKEAQTHDAEEVLQDKRVDSDIATNAEEPHVEEKSAVKPQNEDFVGEVDGIEDVVEDDEEADRGVDTDLTAKQKKCRLVCKECGKRFTRRETFNLHRHFHAHEDELTPLTCKECGLTFQHRSSLIKHRNEHRESEEPQLVTPKKEVQTMEEGIFQCAECERIFSTVGQLRDHNCSNTVEKPYHCPLCRQDFQFKVSVTKHMMTHSYESTFMCQECSQTFPNTTALRFHQRCHAALKPYECPECGMVFKHYSVMEDHRRKHTDNSRSHLCNICGKTFKYSSLLHQHQYLHTGQKPFRCPECGKKFAFAQNMKAHCRQHRLRETNSCSAQTSKQAPAAEQEEVRGPGKENAHQSEEPKRTFNCPLCPQTYCAPANLRAHMLIHEAEYEKLERSPRLPKDVNKYWDKGHTCPHCPSIYRDESSLNVHLLSVHKSVSHYLERLAAPPKKQFTPLTSDNVQVKWKSESISVKSYKCSECGKTFRHRSVLELHMRIHSKDKPYQCKVCGKGFRFSSYLQQHLIIHTGKKPYKCSDCGKDFAFLQNMRTHQKLHQEKPFRCTSCRKGYSDEIQLQHHMLSHNGDKPHKCDQCDKSFGLAYLLRDHMNTHTGERPHRCEECHKTFSWFSSLLVHQKIHARKRQSFSQYSSFPMSSRMRGRGRRGGRPVWGFSRPLGGSGMTTPQQLSYPQHHRTSSSWADIPLISQSGSTSVQSLDSAHTKDGTSSVAASHLVSVPKKSSPSAVNEMVQHRQHKPVSWSSTPTSTVLASTSSVQHEFSVPSSYIDGAALWSVRPTPLVNSQGSPTGASTSAQIDQSSAMPISSPVSHGASSTLWDIQTPPGIPKTINSTEKLVNNQDFQLQQKQASSGWANVQTATQKVPISIQYEPHRFGQGMGTPVWGFQNNPVGPQTLLSGQLKPGNGPELQQQPMVTGTQIIINQPSPFFSPPLAPLPPLALPGPHPLHSVAVGALPRPPHPNIFFTPQAVMSERPHMPQTLSLPQLAPRTETHKLGSRLPFAPERLLQCMICGCSLPRELDLQMHYLQHAQGEI
uniref:Zgc:66448 n=1 Tax=Neolamprologus brichardi TaxID=32507 RepID=A0A3Q4G1Z2_NEOBR